MTNHPAAEGSRQVATVSLLRAQHGRQLIRVGAVLFLLGLLVGLAIYGFLAAWVAPLLGAFWNAGATMMPISSGGAHGTLVQESAIRVLLISAAACQVVLAVMVVWGLRPAGEEAS